MNWYGVRPVRYKDEIFGVLKNLVEEGSISVEGIRKILLDMRDIKEAKRLRALRTSISTANKERKRDVFLTKAEQFVRLLRGIGLITKSGKTLTPSLDAETIVDKLKLDKSLDAETLFLTKLLNSKFKTYTLFLKRLTKGAITIPKELSTRNKEILGNYLASQGFPLDSWSFYVLRDLFYDFGLLNYIINEKEERAFAVCAVRDLTKKFLRRVLTPEGYLYYWRSMNVKEFISNLAKEYLRMTDNKWDRVVNLIALRERFSESYRMSENQFNVLIQQAFKRSVSIKVIPSVGYIQREQRKGYLTKVITLPTDKSGLPFTLVRITKYG